MNYKKIAAGLLFSVIFGFFIHSTFAQTAGTVNNTTVAYTDTIPPSAPVLLAPTVSTSTILISWSSSTDNVSVYGYGVYRNDAFLSSTKSLSYLDANTLQGTSYTYSVVAYDTSSNISLRSAGVSAMIPVLQIAPTDISPPVISLVRVENIVGSGAQIRWATDKPSDSRVLYSTSTSATASIFTSYNTGCQTETITTAHCVNLTSLSPGSVYFYKVESKYVGSTVSSASSDIYYFSVPLLQSNTTTASSTTTSTTSTATIDASTTPNIYTANPLVATTSGNTFVTATTSVHTTSLVSTTTAPDTIVATSTVVTEANSIKMPVIATAPTTTFNTARPELNLSHTIGSSVRRVSEQVNTEREPVRNSSTIRQRPAEKVAPVIQKPLISLLGENNKVSGKTEVYVNLPKSTESVEVRLGRRGLEESLYLGQAHIDSANERFVFSWDSSQTPDGAYGIFPVATMENGRVFRGQGITITIENNKTREVSEVPSKMEIVARTSLATNSITEDSVPPVAPQKPKTDTAKIIDDIRKDQRIKEEQIKKELVGALGRFTQGGDVDTEDLQKIISEKSKEIKTAVDSGDVEKKQEIIMAIVNSSGNVSQANKDLLAKEVESSVTKLEQVADEQKNGVVDVKNFSVDTIKVAEVATKTDGTETAKKIEFKGKALPNSFATLYIFSIPIVVTVKTDNDGYWNYTLDKELEDGKHQVYVGITDVKGNVVAKSQALPFIKVARAVSVAEEEVALASEPQATPSLFSSNYFYGILLIIIMLLVGLLVWIGIKRSDTI